MIKNSQHLVKGTLDLLILRSLSWGPRHGYAISEWIENVTDAQLRIMEGTIYPALHRMENRSWIEAEWGVSKNNRRAKYYRLTEVGRKQLRHESSSWQLYVAAMAKALSAEAEMPA